MAQSKLVLKVDREDAYIDVGECHRRTTTDAVIRLLTSCRKGKLVGVVVTTSNTQRESEMVMRIM